MNTVNGFSKLSKDQKIKYLANQLLGDQAEISEKLKSFWHSNSDSQKIFDEFSENTISNFYLPYGVVPNFMINGKNYCIPMVIEESSVVAACSKTAKFWQSRGGFTAEVVSTLKSGQVHFYWEGRTEKLLSFFGSIKNDLMKQLKPFLENMESRGGGLKSLELLDLTAKDPNYFQIFANFETCDAMGANFINTVLEAVALEFSRMVKENPFFSKSEKQIDIIMAILSNYAPDCLVRAKVKCQIEELYEKGQKLSVQEFIQKFKRAITISQIDKFRATTHNKGILNGIDAVVLATGNDFRAIEAGAHTYASRFGEYQGLTNLKIENDTFEFSIEIPLTLGTVGGLTSLHPLAKISLNMLGNPSAKELMKIVACVGLAQNFSAVKSLVTTGIQKGHMKMHLMNILNHLKATEEEFKVVKKYFSNKIVSFNAVREFLASHRRYH